MALHLATAGVELIGTYRAGAPTVDKVVAQLPALGHHAIALQLDVANTRLFAGFVSDGGNQLVTWIRERMNYLVNKASTAGIGLHASFATTTKA